MKDYIDKNKYYQSAKWKEISDECKRLSDYKCSMCGSTESLNAHHLTYERLGEELQEDLLCVCEECHKKIHGVTKFSNKPPKKIRGGFRMVYEAYDQALIETVTSSKDLMVVTYIRDMFTYTKCEVYLSAKDIASKFDISSRKVESLIKKMVETSLLARVGRGVYRLNPFMYIPFRADAELLQKEWTELLKRKTNET